MKIIPPGIWKTIFSAYVSWPTHGNFSLSENANGLVQLTSKHSFADTLARLESTFQSKGLTTFASIHFSDDDGKAGMKMNPTAMIVFGNPKAGTPLMLASPTLAIDFPLKILVSQDDTGKVWLSYNSLDYLNERHHIPNDLLKNIAGIVPLAEAVAN